ncbi:Hypothetical predicted protein [Olea europaea subsp. europaea]|uniref:Uncharacterized protein n=1 Tax=Olea europaea subsp. europaea TaxID=158383 RepID=A0A8S0RSU1_OLEEU|nr:Hypothetical predicted protein [Olea europaea subsp. europaea]
MKEESQTSPLTQNNVEALCNRRPSLCPLSAVADRSHSLGRRSSTSKSLPVAVESPKAESKSLPLSLESLEAEHNVEAVFSLATARETEQRRSFPSKFCTVRSVYHDIVVTVFLSSALVYFLDISQFMILLLS